MSESESYAYALGRRVGILQAPFRATDLAFGSTRLDGQTIQDSDFKHCTFANISFKKATIQDGMFLDCVFIGCYFRRATLNNSSFVGCRFIDCHFDYIAIKSSQFKYSSFRGCQIPFAELEHSLPPEPNLKEALARNLFVESSRLGLSSEARQYRMTEIKAREAHLCAAVAGSSQWYQEHFNLFERFIAGTELLISLSNRYLWGYGEQIWRLFINVLIISLSFPFIFHFVRSGLRKPADGSINFWPDLFWFSIENVLPAGIRSEIEAVSFMAQFLASVESLFGLLVITLFASYVFRWSLHR